MAHVAISVTLTPRQAAVNERAYSSSDTRQSRKAINFSRRALTRGHALAEGGGEKAHLLSRNVPARADTASSSLIGRESRYAVIVPVSVLRCPQ